MRSTLSVDEHYALGVTAYERVTGMIVSLLILLGAAVFCLAVLWATFQFLPRASALPVLVESIGERGGAPTGVAQEIEPPGLEELPDFQEPRLQETLTLLDVAAQTAAIVELDFVDPEVVAGSGLGDSRRANAYDGDGSGIPRHERWEIRIGAGLTLDAYARQLDFFRIELAAIGGGDDQVVYASKFSQAQPTIRRAPPEKEKRLRMIWRDSDLAEADRQLISQAGVNLRGKQVVQFYDAEAENLLAWAEKDYAGERPISSIRRTVFGVRDTRDGFEFYVISQYYL